MKNLQELIERYKNYPRIIIPFSHHFWYEINSDKGLNLNSYGRFDYVLNEAGEVETYELIDAPYLYFLDSAEITDEQRDNLTEDEERRLEIRHDNVIKIWGKTLDNYYIHPYYPDKKIKGFEIVKMLPLFELGKVYECDDDGIITSDLDWDLSYLTYQCLDYPEFFKPIYF